MKTLKRKQASPGSTNQRKAHLGRIHQAAAGRFQVQVVDAKTGRVVETRPWQKNLILDSGLDRIATETWASQLSYGVAGTGNTPTKDIPDEGDEFDQSGTTITRTTGTRDFSADDIGKLIRWSSGEEAYITAYTSATVVTADRSQTVAAGEVDALYRVAQTGLTTETKRTSTQPEFDDEDDDLPAKHVRVDADAGTITFRVTRDFSEEASPVNYTEVGVSSQSGSGNNLFSRMLLAGAVTVGTGQLLRLKYELTIAVSGHAEETQETVDGGITGWPLPYNIESIVSNGTYWDVTFTEDHHFQAGGKINISGAKRPRADVTAASSTVSDFTITAPGHGLSGGQSVVIEGMTPSGYNGTFVVASVSGDDFTVTSGLNPGVGTVFGNVRQEEPGTWYDGDDYTIASVPAADTVRITNATSIAAAGEDGTGYNNLKRKWVAVGYGIVPFTSGYGAATTNEARAWGYSGSNTVANSYNQIGLFDGSSSSSLDGYVHIPATPPTTLPNDFPQWWGLITAGSYAASNSAGTSQSPSVSDIWTSAATATADVASYTNGDFYREFTVEFGAGSANYSNIRFIGIGLYLNPLVSSIQGYFLFEEPQRKKNTYKLSLTFRKSWGRDLSTIPN